MVKKKVYETKPTIKQRTAFNNSLENRGNIGKAMREAGYTEAYASNPKQLTESKGWQQLLKEKLPDELLADVHYKGLTEPKSWDTKHKYLKTAYELKGKLKETEISSKSGPVNLIIDL